MSHTLDTPIETSVALKSSDEYFFISSTWHRGAVSNGVSLLPVEGLVGNWGAKCVEMRLSAAPEPMVIARSLVRTVSGGR